MAGISWYQNENSNGALNQHYLIDHIPLYSLADVQLRFLCPNDLDEVRTLCQDWFPIEYPLSWYEEITSGTRFYALAATYNQIIIGLIVAEIKPYASLNSEDQGFLANSFLKHSDVAYILSLGVAKQYRRNGIASLLLNSLINHLTSNDRNKIKAIFLHVLTTNSAAIMFYENKKFKLHCFLPYYYSIKGRCNDGFTYVLYVNGGHSPWTLIDYLRYFCKNILLGGGAFPWLLSSFSKFRYWMWSSRKITQHPDVD